MSMSLDGFIAGPNERPGNGLGDGGDRLHEWVFEGESGGPSGVPGRPSGVNGQVYDEIGTPARSSPAGGPSSQRAAGAATTTTVYRSSFSAASNRTAQ
jgi:hypothetical protein